MKYRKKPVVIEATQWFPGVEIDGVICKPDLMFLGSVKEYGEKYGAEINTLEGPLHVSPGDWIITGVKGERYPCKPDIFELTYEPA